MISSEILKKLKLPKDISIKEFIVSDYDDLKELYREEGWMTFVNRSEDGKIAWMNSNIAFLLVKENKIIGFIRGLTDGYITTYIAEILISKEFRGMGLGNKLFELCSYIYPKTRIEVLSSELSKEFYKKNGFREMSGFRKSNM